MRVLLAFVVAFAIGCTAPIAPAPSGDGDRDPSGALDPSGPSSGHPPGSSPGASPPGEPDAPPLGPEFDDAVLAPFFDAQMKAAHVPGAAVAVVKNGHVGWSHGYGLADIPAKKAVTPDTLFMLASISKTMVSVALMKLIEDPARGLSLDQDVGTKLPFKVRNPKHPSTPITFRMILTHSSSIVDGGALDASDSMGDSPIALQTWLVSTLARSDAWSSGNPGTAFSYSNTAATLAGLLVQTISGTTLEDFCKQSIWTPLAMNETSWFLAGLDKSHVAMPYEQKSGSYVAQGLYGFPDYPDGQLRTSANQLGRFLGMFAEKGSLDGVAILKSATVDEMRKPQIPAIEPTQGLIWFYDDTTGTKLLGHNGAYLGVSTDMFFDPTDGAGYVLLTNGGVYYADVEAPAQLDAMAEMNTKLLALAKALP